MRVAREALDLAKDVDHRVNAHEDICALRYKRLEENITAVRSEVATTTATLKSDIGDIKKILAWAGTTGFAVILAVLGVLVKAQFDSNTEMQRTIQDLQRHQSVYEQPR